MGGDREVKTCSFDGCDRPSRARNLCRAHYDQWRLNVPLRPIGEGHRRGRNALMTVREVAEALGISRQAVLLAERSGLAKLRAKIGPEGVDMLIRGA